MSNLPADPQDLAAVAIDLAACPQCGSPVTLIAAIEEPAVIVKILAHLGLPHPRPQWHSFKE